MRKLLVIAVCLVAFTWVLLVIARHVLSNNGISYDRLSFRFPSTATVEGLHINMETLDLQAGKVHVQWSWRALLRGDIQGKLLIVKDAEILIKPGTSEPDSSSSVPLIDIQRASLENVTLKWGNESDSTDLVLKQV